MSMTWTEALLGQLDFYWTVQLRPRLEGLTDEEYLWEPAVGAWSVRPDADGRLVLDFAEPEPPNPPVTTIAWRSVHIGRDVLGKRARAFFGPTEAPDDAGMFDDRHWPEPLPGTAAGALELLDQAYRSWRAGVAALDDETIRKPLGPKGGPYAEDSMAGLVLHINREVIAHGAELCLLRDLYRARHDHADPVVAAAHRGDAAEVGRLVDDGAAVRPTLLAEAAGRRYWDVVRALVTRGVPVGDEAPSALHFAAADGELDLVELLLEHGADATAVDGRFRQPPAGWADYFGHPEVAARLRVRAR
jgi:hypothetical protein